MSKEYWWCRIGPIERSKVPEGGDYPMRVAVKGAFGRLTGEGAEVCSSGWGMDEEAAKAAMEVHHEYRERKAEGGSIKTSCQGCDKPLEGQRSLDDQPSEWTCQCEEPRDCETAVVCQTCGKPLRD